MINKAERHSIPWCGVRCDRQVRAVYLPHKGPEGWDKPQQNKPFHNETKNLARKKPREGGTWAERESKKERDSLGSEVVGVVGCQSAIRSHPRDGIRSP